MMTCREKPVRAVAGVEEPAPGECPPQQPAGAARSHLLPAILLLLPVLLSLCPLPAGAARPDGAADLHQLIMARSAPPPHFVPVKATRFNFGSRKLCGKNLSAMLYYVCKQKQMGLRKREMNSLSDDTDSNPFLTRSNNSPSTHGGFVRVTRGAYDECCANRCSVQKLMSYCG